MKVDITGYNVAVTLTKPQFRKHFLYPGDEGAFEFLQKHCPNCYEINYDGHFGPHIFFSADVKEYEKAKAQMTKAIEEWMAIEKPH